MSLSLDQSQVDAGGNITALYCATDDYPTCLGLCPNPDLAGIGVRAAFYSQSFMNALLIWLSPEDSAAGAWASTILTIALVAPAIRAKMERQLTLHHATLVLNFATLSTIASMATAPMVPIWRVLIKRKKNTAQEAEERATRRIMQRLQREPTDNNDEDPEAFEKEATRNIIQRIKSQQRCDDIQFQRELEERARGRIILSLALGVQIVLQWAWTVLMFVDPFYSQPPCTPDIRIVFLAGTQTADQINENFGPWATWLVLCFSASLIFGIIMVFSCTSKIHETPLKYDYIKRNFPHKGIRYRLECIKYFLYPKDDPDVLKRWTIRCSQLFALTIVIGFIIVSEQQIKENEVVGGEGDIWSFSQSAAVFLALSPLWAIGIAWLKENESPLLPVEDSRMVLYGKLKEGSLDQLLSSTSAPYQYAPLNISGPDRLDSLGRYRTHPSSRNTGETTGSSSTEGQPLLAGTRNRHPTANSEDSIASGHMYSSYSDPFAF